jgi:hypothetical protein
MLLYKKKIVFAVVTAFFCMSGFSQKNTDGNFLFKTWIYLEHINDGSRYNVEFPVKDSAVFSLFVNNINLRLDTLKSDGFSDDYIFLAVNFKSQKERAEGKDSSLIYSKTKFLQYIVIPTLCSRYVLCINKVTGFSYRIQGFSGNDFFNLLKDVKDEFSVRYKKQLKTKTFLKEYSAGDIDFKCIYKGLQSGQYDFKKYPCLYDCRGSNEIIWTQ